MSGKEPFITEGMAAIVIITASHGEKGDKNNGNYNFMCCEGPGHTLLEKKLKLEEKK